jgi:protocatechuate 3,4-dioxygenase beta subunit
MSYRNASALTWARAICSLLGAGAAIAPVPAGAAPPDLQGIWTAGTATPFERPDELPAGQSLSDSQAAILEQRQADFVSHKSIKASEVGHDNEAFMETYKVLATRQASQVVFPTDGKVPLTPEAERRRDYNLNNYDSYESMSPWDRCITRGPTGLLPAAYNNGYQIVQTPTHVLIFAEMIHEARVIQIDGRAHADARIRSWEGDSRGRWEGETLVVETKNFNGKGWIATHLGAGRLRGVPVSENLRVLERFTRIDNDTLNYEITVEDPQMFRSRWTAAMPFARDDSYQIFEYACHEGNSATDMILRGARVQEAKSATNAAEN